MDISYLLLAEKVAASAGIGLLIGLQREWSHKDAGVRSFTIVALFGMISWMVNPVLAYIEVATVLVIIALINIHFIMENQPLEITTAISFALTNVLGMLVGGGSFFLAFTCAIVVTALLSWKTELVAFTSKLSIVEIRGALLMGFIIAVVYPLLPDGYLDPWHIVNPRSIWLTVIIVSALNFINYILLRQLGMKGVRYAAILGGLVNSAATSALLGTELKNAPDFAVAATPDLLLADLAMLVRNGVLVALFSLAVGPEASIAVLVVLGPMALVTALISVFMLLRSRRKPLPLSHELPLKSPLALSSVLNFGLLFLSLTVIGGLAQRFFGAIGFLAVIVFGSLASAASSSVLVGTQVSNHLIAANAAAVAMYLASLVGLLENVVIFYVVARNRKISIQLALLTLPVVIVGGLAVGALLWWGIGKS
ncbi:MAG TPA: DUF4010 domain-containing protein [Ktedonobacteraceae bacterium]|nr:DUF4010 domain-containing protein [Ktedonobacteraceae bacterium]